MSKQRVIDDTREPDGPIQEGPTNQSYASALSAAGAVVHSVVYTNDYQGTWMAFVAHKGQTGFVSGWFGSCGGCDDFQAFEYRCEGEPTQAELARFGSEYLDNIESLDEVRRRYEKQSEWCMEADETLRWIEEQGHE